MVVFSLTLIRHGETLANRENIIQGQTDIPLSDVGLKQAKLVGVRLQNEQFSHVFASDLLRAAQTAQAIVEANKLYISKVIKDKRLRERKFGNVEGKTFKELAVEAKKHNTSIPCYTPSGAEKIEQVRARARSFFRDLISLLKSNAGEDGNYIPGSIKRRAEQGFNCNSDSSRNPRQASVNSLSMITLNHNIGDTNDSVKRPRHGELEIQINSFGAFPTEQAADKVFEEGELLDTSPKLVIARSGSSSSSGCSSLPDSSESQEHALELSTLSAKEQNNMWKSQGTSLRSTLTHDTEIKTNIHSQQSDEYGCPNVSLSPLLEHRLSSISSISSGRNSSFDDTDGIPPYIADVIIVSHGGFLKELIRHFVEDLKCKMPMGKGYALRVGPNASVSKFTVTIDDFSDIPVITCLLIHDKEHLQNMDMAEPPGLI